MGSGREGIKVVGFYPKGTEKLSQNLEQESLNDHGPKGNQIKP